MAKVVKEINITIKVIKGLAGEVTVTETADFEVGLEEYPDFPKQRRVIVVALTPAQKTDIVSHVKNVILAQVEAGK